MRNIHEHLKGFSHKLARRRANGTLTDVEHATASIMLEQQIALNTLHTLYYNQRGDLVLMKQAFDGHRKDVHDYIDDVSVTEDMIGKLTFKLQEEGIIHDEDL
jgi:hypothetical protein